MRLRLSFCYLLTIALTTQVAAAQTHWFPPEARANAAAELARRLAEIDLGTEVDDAGRQQIARTFVSGLTEGLDTWGVDKIVAGAPDLSEFDYPSNDNRYLDAMARYGSCNFYLQRIFANAAADAEDPAFRVRAAMGLMTVSIMNLKLLDAYTQDGGSAEGFQAYFQSDEVLSFSPDPAVQGKLLQSTREQCGAVLTELLGE